MSFLWICIGVVLAKSSKWAYSYFGLSSFEQIVFHIKVPLEGTNTEFIRGWIKQCVIPGIFCGTLLCWIDIHIAHILFIIFILYGLYQIQILPYILHQFQKTNFYDQYYVKQDIISPEHKKNFIHIYLESMETTYAKKAEGGASDEDLLPFLTQLTKENISFSDTKQIGGANVLTGAGWTTGGIVAASSATPLIWTLAHPFNKKNDPFMKDLDTLLDVLHDDGYKQVFMIGSDATFGGRRSFFQTHGDVEILDTVKLKEMGKLACDYHEFWGFEDDKLFAYAKEELTQLSKQEKPFHFTMLTVDTHHPYGYQGKFTKKLFKLGLSDSIYHTDELLHDFIDWLQKQDFYKDTVIVIHGDHTSMAAEYIHAYHTKHRRVWNVFIHSQVKAKHTHDRVFTTFDFYPTILASLGYTIKSDRIGLGTNLFSDKKTLTEEMDLDFVNKEITKKSNLFRRLSR